MTNEPARPGAPRPWPVLSPAAAAWLAAAWTAALAIVSLVLHPTPFYRVETDLVGEYLPAARELASGVVTMAHYAFKGPVYPLLLAWLAAPLHGDVLVASRLLSPLAGGFAAWLAWALARRAAGDAVATFTLLALLASPMFVTHAIEAGTDLPALAFMLGATLLVLGEGGVAALAAAGALTGIAILTRTNALFLAPCALLVLLARPRRVVSLLAWVFGAAAPLALWAWVAARHGGLPADRNYLNVAWELYGHGVPWDQFQDTIGARFHSLAGVLAYDPALAARRIAANLVMQRVSDARELVGIAPALLAVPGLLLLAARKEARGWLLHALACALVLAPVFYNPRFALYLLPLFLAAAGACLAWLAAASGAWARPARIASALAGAVLVAWLGVTAARQTSANLTEAPHEVRLAGEALARLGYAGEKILARKPHVAYFGRMAFVPLPAEVPLSALPAWANAQGARLLFFSGIEQVMRPGDAVLADSGVALPGYVPLLWRRLPHEHFYAVYKLDPAPVDSATFATAYRAALVRYEARRPASAEALMYVAIQWLALGDPAAALQRLGRLGHSGAHGEPLERYRGMSFAALGQLDSAAAAFEEGLKLAPPTAELWARLGEVRARQGRNGDALSCFRHAAELEPASLEHLARFGWAQAVTHDMAGAAATFERASQLAPGDVQACRHAIGAWTLLGDDARAKQAYARGVAAGIPPAALEIGPR